MPFILLAHAIENANFNYIWSLKSVLIGWKFVKLIFSTAMSRENALQLSMFTFVKQWKTLFRLSSKCLEWLWTTEFLDECRWETQSFRDSWKQQQFDLVIGEKHLISTQYASCQFQLQNLIKKGTFSTDVVYHVSLDPPISLLIFLFLYLSVDFLSFVSCISKSKWNNVTRNEN